MKKRQRTPTPRARKATQTQPRKKGRQVRPRATVSAVVSAPAETVWMGPAVKAPKTTATVANPALADDGSELNTRTDQWVCRYGCIGFKLGKDAVMFHHHSCPYWMREGRNKTPF